MSDARGWRAFRPVLAAFFAAMLRNWAGSRGCSSSKVQQTQHCPMVVRDCAANSAPFALVIMLTVGGGGGDRHHRQCGGNSEIWRVGGGGPDFPPLKAFLCSAGCGAAGGHTAAGQYRALSMALSCADNGSKSRLRRSQSPPALLVQLCRFPAVCLPVVCFPTGHPSDQFRNFRPVSVPRGECEQAREIPVFGLHIESCT